MPKLLSILGLWIMFPVCSCADRDQSPGHPYAGERVEIIVPFREGGGTDTWARVVAPFLQRHLGTDVSVRVMNVLGASGIQGGNEFALRRSHDGLTLFVSSGSNTLPYLLGERAVRYDFAEFAGVLGAPTGGVVFVAPNTDVERPADLCTATDLIYGGISPTGLDMVPLLAFELLGLDYTSVLGYQGKGAARLAFERGETNLDYQTSAAYLANVIPLVEEGAAVPVFSFGAIDSAGHVVRDPIFADLPSMTEMYETCRGNVPSGTEWDAYRAVLSAGFAAQKGLWVHADAPVRRINALRTAANAVLEDPEFLQLADELIGGYGFYAGEAVNANFEATVNIPSAAREWLIELLREKYDVAI